MELVEPESFELPANWKIPKAWADWAMEERKWKLPAVKRSAKKFHEYHRAHHTTRDTFDLWEFSFKAWIRNERDEVKEVEEGQHQGRNCLSPGCTEAGCLSESTTGGRWYCWSHFQLNPTREA